MIIPVLVEVSEARRYYKQTREIRTKITASDLGVGILSKASVEDGIGNLIADLVWKKKDEAKLGKRAAGARRRKEEGH